MSVRLPPFSGLTAFYAAVRHGTLTGAAQDLNVSQPAVTRRIAALEEDLGCKLFDRSHKPAQMTQQGRELMRVLRSGFGQIETVVEQLRQGSAKRVVTVTGPSGFVGFWLIPRLAELEAAFPELTIRIVSQEYGDPARPGDVSIRFGTPLDSGDRRILGEDVYPVASPLYLERRGAVADRTDFSRVTLLTMQAARQHWHDWPSWFSGADEIMPKEARLLDFNSYAMIVNAALAAQGVCLCWAGLLDSFVSTGALVRLGDKHAISTRGYFVSMHDGLAARHEAQEIFQWIVDAAEFSD
jgi:DNA-binding transcriptional LysR family regulator